MELKIAKLDARATIPTKAYEHAAGYDLYSLEDADLRLVEPVAIRTGIAMEFPPGYVGLIWDRSGLGSKGIHRLAGVIDADYRGEWKVILVNVQYKKDDSQPFKLPAGSKIAQVIFQKCENWPIVECLPEELTNTERGERGFASSDQLKEPTQ